MGPQGSHFPCQAPSALVGSGIPGQTQGAQHSLWSEKEGPPGTEEVGLAFPSPGDLPDPGIKPGSLALQADFLPSESHSE